MHQGGLFFQGISPEKDGQASGTKVPPFYDIICMDK